MKAYLAWFGEYVLAVLLSWDTGVGIIGTIAAFLFTSSAVALAIALIMLAEATYRVFRKEREMRADREALIHADVWPTYYKVKVEKSHVRFEAYLHWEFWMEQPITTDAIGMGVIGVRRRPRWKIWKSREHHVFDIAAKKIESNGDVKIPDRDVFQYRRDIAPFGAEPFRDGGFFEGEFQSSEPYDDVRLELVLKLGRPFQRFRFPVRLDSEKLIMAGRIRPSL